MKIQFEIIAPDGAVHHRGSFHQYDAVERRAFAERIASCQANGYEVRTWMAGQRPARTFDAVSYNDSLYRAAELTMRHGLPTRMEDGQGWLWDGRTLIHQQRAKRTKWRRVSAALGLAFAILACVMLAGCAPDQGACISSHEEQVLIPQYMTTCHNNMCQQNFMYYLPITNTVCDRWEFPGGRPRNPIDTANPPR